MPGQGDRSEPVVLTVRIEQPAMPPRLVPLRDDGVHTCRRGEPGFMKTCGRAEKDNARLAHRPDPFGSWQAEVEAHDLRPRGEQGRQHVLVLEKTLIDLAEGGGRLGANSVELRAQTLEPRGLALCVRSRRMVTEQIHIQRSIR